MAINIKFDLANNPETPTLILANRNGNKLGQLDVNPESVELIDKLNEASEVSFTINKYIDGKITNLWDKILDFKLVYCKEWQMWFEIKVELDEATESVKTVFCTQLGQAELSQIMLYDIEINTEDDIARDDYKIAILYDPYNSQCILSRLLDKAPHYSLYKVDNTLMNIQRSFSFDSTSIYDAFQEIAEEIGCLFIFHSDSDENGMPRRMISVRDLQQNCNDCGYRGEFTDKCPKCGSTNIKYGYGEDTLIFVTSDELASEGIQLVTDTDSVKNCFKLEAGDDLMTATVRNRNPNGTDYIWYFSDATKEDMPDELVKKIEEYDNIYKYYYKEHSSNLNSALLSGYNSLVNKYLAYNEDLEKISNPIVGFASLMQAYYNAIDLGWYLKSGLMPNVTMGKTNAEEQGLLLSTSLPPLIAVTDLNIVSKATADSAVLTMAKAIVSSAYKVTINSSSLSGSNWSGIFTITNYSDEDDTYTTSTISRSLIDWEEDYIKQKIEKILSKENTDNLSIAGLFEKEYADFCEELHKYALTPLTSFHDACQACLDILIEQGVGNDASDLYNGLYLPYYNKLKAIELEMADRENEVNTVIALQTDIEKIKVQIQNQLNFENYLGENLWLQFCAYRREDKYINSNYISDGLNNAELFERALQFYEVAENEIFKSAELQHSISATLNNLLAIPKFKPLVESFEVGNWIRVQVDDFIYKLRLVEYEISYGDFESISVEFSDVAKTKNGYSDLEDILSDASSMATSYDSIQRQANLGNEARDMIRQWLNEGLDASLIQIQNNTNEDIVIDNNGLIGRSYSDITEEYSDEQIRLTHNIIAFTDDNWKSVKQAIGKHKYKYFDEGKDEFVDALGYGVSADFMTAGVVSGSQIIGGNIYSDNYSPSGGNGSYINLRKGDFSFGGGALRFEINDETNKGKLIISSDPTSTNVTELNDEWLKTTSVYAQNLQVNSAKITGKLTANQIDASELKVDAANITGTLTIGQLGTDIATTSDIPKNVSDLNNDMGYQNYTGVTTIVNGVVTTDYVNALNITAQDFKATTITGKEIYSSYIDGANIVGSDIDVYGVIDIFDNSGLSPIGTVGYAQGSTDFGVTNGIGIIQGMRDQYGNYYGQQKCYTTTEGAALSSNEDQAIYGDYWSKIAVSYGAVSIISSQTVTIETGNTQMYGTIWHNSTVVSSSDRNVKHDINYNLEKYENMYDNLLPCTYKFNYGTSDRYHTGFIAQEVKDAIVNNDLTTSDFAAYVEMNDNNYSEYGKCGLRYEEFIALNTWQIQKLKKRIAALEEQISNLNNQLNFIV